MATGMCVVRHTCTSITLYKISVVIVVSYMDRDVILGTWYLWPSTTAVQLFTDGTCTRACHYHYRL